MMTLIEQTTKYSAVIRLATRAWAVATKELVPGGKWSGRSGGPAGTWARWVNGSLPNLAATLIAEHRRHGHVAHERTRRAAREIAEDYGY